MERNVICSDVIEVLVELVEWGKILVELNLGGVSKTVEDVFNHDLEGILVLVLVI